MGETGEPLESLLWWYELSNRVASALENATVPPDAADDVGTD